jgi:competence protein ComEC
VTGGFMLLSGVLLALGSAALPAMWWMSAAVASALLVFVSPLRHRASSRAVALLLAGMGLAWGVTHHWLTLRMPASAAGVRVLIDARIVTVPARDGGALRFDAVGTILDGQQVPDERVRRARLIWRDPVAAPRAGERWRLLVRLAPLADTRNFAGSDSSRFAFRDRIHLAGRVLPSRLNTRLALAPASVNSLRARVAGDIHEQVADPDAAALLTALAVGITDGMSADQWRVFNATGTTHLVAISGLHVTLFALVAFLVARVVWRVLHRVLPWACRIDREPFALLLGLAAAGGYSLLAGFSVPTQRTWLMLAVMTVARLAARHTGAGRIWTLALIAVLCLDPLAPLSAGFWLSFVAVGVILIAAAAAPAGTTGALPWMSGLVRLQFAIMTALLPLTFAVFSSASLAGLWVNLLAIPFVSFVLVPLVLAGALAVVVMPSLSHACFASAATLYEWTWPALVWAADSPLALWRVTPAPWWFAFALLAAVVSLLRWPLALRLTALCATLPLLFAPARGPAPGALLMSVIDAGRGSAALLVTRSRVVLFDTGDSWNTQGSRMRELILPALDALGRRTVDLLVLPSLTEDRAGGAALLAFERQLRAVRVGGSWSGTSLPVASCVDAEFRWDGVHFETFAAGAGGQYCVLRASVGTHAILLAGDLDSRAELALASRVGADALASEIVLMSRQASSQASAPQWIEATAAGIAIAAGGIADHQSRAITLERWRRSGAMVLDTRRDGAIELEVGTGGVRMLADARRSRYPFVWRRAP